MPYENSHKGECIFLVASMRQGLEEEVSLPAGLFSA